MKINEFQSKAIRHGNGAMLVLAGPGSGKTLVITHRIKNLIEEYGVRPEQILVITFTKAAAKQMQARFTKLVENKAYMVNFGTFHAIFFQILRHAYKFGAENIIREPDKYSILEEIIRELSIDIECNNELIQHMLEEISRIKNSGASPDTYQGGLIAQADFENIFKAYKHVMNSKRLIDFDDMALMCIELFSSRPEILKMWQERFKFILIDEFQDISPLQYEVVKMLAKPQDNIFIVGDDDQSIYGFRGADPKIMLNFKNDYPDADEVTLSVNYRSGSSIVETAGKLIGNNSMRFAKRIESGNDIRGITKIYSFTSKNEQAQGIDEAVKQYMQMNGARYSDMAILFRTSTGMMRTVDRLVRSNIPFVMKEKPRSIYDSETSKDIAAYLRYALKEDNVADFYRIMNRPVRYIKRSSVPTKPFKMKELLQNNAEIDYVIQNITQFYSHLQFIRHLQPFSAVNYIRKGVGYDEYLKKQGRESDIEALDELQEQAKDFETIEEWLEHIEKMLSKDHKQDSSVIAEEKDAVTLMTMHASKGLEWKMVILPDINEGVVPHKKAVTDSELEEERRMFYVALTRAKEYLFIFYIHEEKAGKFLPSRFIEEIM